MERMVVQVHMLLRQWPPFSVFTSQEQPDPGKVRIKLGRSQHLLFDVWSPQHVRSALLEPTRTSCPVDDSPGHGAHVLMEVVGEISHESLNVELGPKARRRVSICHVIHRALAHEVREVLPRLVPFGRTEAHRRAKNRAADALQQWVRVCRFASAYARWSSQFQEHVEQESERVLAAEGMTSDDQLLHAGCLRLLQKRQKCCASMHTQLRYRMVGPVVHETRAVRKGAVEGTVIRHHGSIDHEIGEKSGALKEDIQHFPLVSG
mmetsp:Transcript_39021/g.107467  ORF Transcript_39021/g.107467 Transcript_39021/m.107467 type:complete len:263 (+) Transcript_39021:188-976(+)